MAADTENSMETRNLKECVDFFNMLTKKTEFADIRLESSSSQVIIKEGNKIRENSVIENEGFGIRIFNKGIWYFSSGTSITQERIKKAIDSIDYKIHGNSFNLEPEINNLDIIPRWKVDVRTVPADKKIEVINQLYSAAKLKNIKTTIIYYQDNVNHWVVGNNKGALVSFYDSYPGIIIESFVRDSNSTQSIRKSINSNGGFELFDSDRITNLGRSTSEEALKLINAKPVKGGKYDVVLDHSMTGVYSHEAFGHAAEADGIINKASILRDKIDKNVGPAIINITDDPTISGLRGSYCIDQEGVKPRKRRLVENGVLKTYLNSLETASQLNAPFNGAARATDFGSLPIPRMSNTFIEAGDFSDDIYEGIKEGIAFYGFNYGYTDPGSGKFMFKSQYGRRIVNGKLKEYVRDAALAGSTLDILNRVDAIGKDIKFEGGSCGKMGQWVPVTSGGPNIRVRGVVVGGQ